MWQHSEMDNNTEGTHNNWDQPWPCLETLRSLTELNEQCLQLMKEQALVQAPAAPPVFQDLADLWAKLDAAPLRRAAACPYLLMDAGFADPFRWRWSGANRVADMEPAAYAPCFTAFDVTNLTYQIFTSAWYIVRTQLVGAPLFLGMPLHYANVLRGCTLRQVTEIANQHTDYLRPRWAGRVKIWREFLTSAISGDAMALEVARLHGVQLLASEIRALEQVGEKPARGLRRR